MKGLLTAQEWAGLSEELQNYGSRYEGKKTNSAAPVVPKTSAGPAVLIPVVQHLAYG